MAHNISDLSPIILFVYNRPEHTLQTLLSLQNCQLANQSILYIFSDGPKESMDTNSINSIYEVRKIIRRNVWCKETIIIESETNKGLADSIINGVTKVINKHGKAIILEDDLIMSKGFLKYMNDALIYYQDVENVMHISGYMFPVKNNLPETFFFGSTSCWGWATWARAWKSLIIDPIFLYNKVIELDDLYIFNAGNPDQKKQLYDNACGNKKTWSIKWHASVYLNKGLCLHPGKSLVNNIGHDGTGENCAMQKKYTWNKLANKINLKEIPLKNSMDAIKAVEDFFSPSTNLSSMIKNKVPASLKPFLKMVRSPDKILEKIELKRVSNIPRFKKGDTKIFRKNFTFIDSASFVFTYKEIFKNEIYKFNSINKKPLIIDCGANVGLSILYFKKNHPDASIVAFEPDKKIFKILEQNINTFFPSSDITLINKGVWNEETTLHFYEEGADGGRIVSSNDNNNIIDIQTVRLNPYIHAPIDFLKIDIEGAETTVLQDCKDLLVNVKNLFVEYHSFVNEKQTLGEILDIISRAGFRVFVSSPNNYCSQPFIKHDIQSNMDLQLNIFAYRV